MAAPHFNSKSPTIRRILKEAAEISNAPSAEYTASPLDTDLFEWHFTFRGPPNSVYADGIYHGRIVLPPTYPLRPPSFRFATPSGRFEVNREICLSISGHHEETWQPAWGVRTALVALRSFMETDPRGQLGGLETSDTIRKRHATASHSYKCAACGKTNEEIIKDCENAARLQKTSPDVDVPSDLKMGWRDELGKSTDPAVQKQSPEVSTTKESRDRSAELAEGFVSTSLPSHIEDSPPVTEAEVPNTSSAPNPAPATKSQRSPTAGSRPSAPAPTRTVSLPLAPNIRPNPVQQRPLDGGVPVWIDRAIVVIVFLLVAIVVRAYVDV